MLHRRRRAGFAEWSTAISRAATAALLALACCDAAATDSPGVTLDPARVEAFVDGKVNPALESSGVPGAVVVVVQRDRVVLAKGYGLADVAAKRPVDAATTLFNTASIGKSMAAIVTLQLVEEGRLDLNADVNRYLKSAHVSGPKVTLRTLLTHRAGFDDDISGLFVPFDADTSMTADELSRRLVPLVPPGYVTAYDNQGYGVVGLMLGDVTGKPLPELYRERLFEPLGMSGAVLGRPRDGRERLARCYTVQGPGSVHECEYWLYRDGLRGAGGVAASGTDMARYMRMLLNHGTLDGRQVLSPAAFANLTNFDHYRFHPGMPGGGFSFIQFEEFRGLEYAHSGSMPGFSSMMTLYPDADVGIFVSFLGGQVGSLNMNLTTAIQALRDLDVQAGARDGLDALRQLTDTIVAEFIPADRPRSSEGGVELQGVSDPQPAIDAFLGSYVLTTAHSRTYAARVFGWGSTVTIEQAGPESIRFAGPQAALGEFRRVGPLLYENDKKQRVAFAELATGRYMAVGLSGGMFRKTNALETPGWALPLFAICTLAMLTALFRLRKRTAPRLRRVATMSLAGFALVLAGLFAEWQWGVDLAVTRGEVVVPALWRLALHAGAVLLAWSAIRYVRERSDTLSRIGRVHGWLLAGAAFGTVVVLLAWRVLGAFPPQVWW